VKEEEKFMLFSDHNGSLPRRQPGAYRFCASADHSFCQTVHSADVQLSCNTTTVVVPRNLVTISKCHCVVSTHRSNTEQ